MKLSVCVAAFVVGSLLPAWAQQPAPKPPDHMQHRFDDPAKFAKSFDDPKRDAWQMPDRVIAALALKPNQSVADIGAGNNKTIGMNRISRIRHQYRITRTDGGQRQMR